MTAPLKQRQVFKSEYDNKSCIAKSSVSQVFIFVIKDHSLMGHNRRLKFKNY